MERSAVLASCTNGWAYDHCQAISDSVLGSGFKCPPHFFSRSSPYYSVHDDNKCESPLTEKGGRKRKRCNSVCSGQDINGLNHEEIEKLAIEIIQLVKSKNLKWVCGKTDMSEGCTATIKDPIDYVGLSNLAHNCMSFDQCEDVTCLPLDGRVGNSVVAKVTKNSSETSILMNALGAKFIIPPLSVFLMSDIEDINRLLGKDKKYDFIVIDPPWHNKSVKRAKSYNAMTFNKIKTLPIKYVASHGCLVAVWVTNKKKIIDFVKEELFPHWALELVGQWYWIKLTTNGEFVCSFQSSHKKPYECLIIGCFNKSRRCDEHVVNSRSEMDEQLKGIPFHQIICSVPCSLHSRKPTLYDFFKGYLPKEPRCLELFARNLLPSWTSWGNEVLKYQNLIYFEKMTS